MHPLEGRLKRPLAALAALMGLAPAASAAPSAQVPVGPRAVAMSGAFTSIADDASALFWNPAGLVRIGHQELAVTTADLYDTGIRDTYASFVLPLSLDLATALDWYHSGFDDGELDFSENRVTLGAAFKVRPWLHVGAGGKLLTRNTGLDGLDVRDERGFGFDLGFMAAPMGPLRIGLVAQDLFDTEVEDADGVSDVAYEQNLRLGASYAYRRWGTAALEVDDRWHLGCEITPHEMIALRFGTEDDREGDERATWSYGLGFKAKFLRVDWARVEHPTLASTDHFSLAMEFNFNPAQVRLEKMQVNEVYTSLYKSYARDSFGTVQVRNLQDRPLETRIAVFVPELMDAPSEQQVVLRPKATQEVPITGVFSERALSQRGDQPVQVQVTASYQSQRLARRERAMARTVAYAPGAITWSEGADPAAAFVTPRDPAVDALAREAGRVVALRDTDPFGNRNLSFAAVMVEALATIGVAYVPDPANPFSTIAETPKAVDTIHYPYQTLERRSGDCDDTTVLLASLLGNVGVATRFVDAPGHVFLLAGAGLHERNRAALGVDESMYTIGDGEVWVPIETTAIGKGFAEAWRLGATEFAALSARGDLEIVDVAAAQQRFEPAVPPGTRKPAVLDTARLAARLVAARDTVAAWRDTFFRTRYGAVSNQLVVTAGALEEVARVSYLGGDRTGAREQLGRALEQAPQSVSVHNNLGVVLASLDSLERAEQHWNTALALGAREAAVPLNLGLARLARGDSVGAVVHFASGLSRAGGYEAACALIGLPPRESTSDPIQLKVRRTLQRAATQSPGDPVASPGTVRGGREGGPVAVSPANRLKLDAYWCWIE